MMEVMCVLIGCVAWVTLITLSLIMIGLHDREEDQ